MLQALERANRLFLQQNNYNADNYSALYAKKGSLIVTDHHLNKWENIPFDFPNMKVLLVDASVPRISVWNEESLFEPENALLLGDLRELKQSVYGGWHYINNVTDINEELSVNRIASHAADRANAISDATTELAQKLGREATLEELCEYMSLSEDEVRDVMKMSIDAMTITTNAQDNE